MIIDFYAVEKNLDFTSSVKSNVESRAVSLRENGFLAFPWRRDSLTWMFEQFENDNFKWREDINHSITLVKPFNIYFVNGGNHSIACGKFFNTNGMLHCDAAVDYTGILKEYDYDGKYYRNQNGKKINKPYLKELSDLFFLGKVMAEIKENLSAPGSLRG